MFKNDVSDLFNYVCNDVLIHTFEHMAVKSKWQVILTDSGYNNFNMCIPLGYKIISRMLICSRKRNQCVDEINLIMIL